MDGIGKVPRSDDDDTMCVSFLPSSKFKMRVHLSMAQSFLYCGLRFWLRRRFTVSQVGKVTQEEVVYVLFFNIQN